MKGEAFSSFTRSNQADLDCLLYETKKKRLASSQLFSCRKDNVALAISLADVRATDPSVGNCWRSLSISSPDMCAMMGTFHLGARRPITSISATYLYKKYEDSTVVTARTEVDGGVLHIVKIGSMLDPRELVATLHCVDSVPLIGLIIKNYCNV